MEIYHKRERDGRKEGCGLEKLILRMRSLASRQVSFRHIALFLLQRDVYTIGELAFIITKIIQNGEQIDISSQNVKEMLGFSFQRL